MDDTTLSPDLRQFVTCPSSTTGSQYSKFKDVSACILPGFNVSNLSETSFVEGAVKARSVSVELAAASAPLEWEELWRGIPLGIVLALLCLLTTIGNVMVLHAVRTEKRLQTVSNLFIVSLAVADVIVGIIVMPMSAVYIFTERWMLGVAVCQIWMGVDYTASTASILNLFILSLDRYWSVRQPLKYLHKRTKRRALSMIAFVWAVSSLWIIPITSWHYFAHHGVRTVPHDKCDTEYAKNSFFKIITAFFNFYLPLSVMYILYLRIFIAIRKRSEFELGQRSHGGPALSMKSNIPNSHSLDDSEGNDDSPCSVDQRTGCSGRARRNGATPHIPSSGGVNLRMLSVKRQPRPSATKDGSSGLYKMEYVYDENVIDPQTEQIQRYFYEDHYPVSCVPKPTWTVGSERIAVTTRHLGIPRTPQLPGDFSLSSNLNYKLSVTSNSLKTNQVCLSEDIQQGSTTANKQGMSVKKSVFRQKKSKKSTTRQPENAQKEEHKKRDPKDNSISSSVCIEQNVASSSSSSSLSIFEERRSDIARMKGSPANDARIIRDKNGEIDWGISDISRESTPRRTRTHNIRTDVGLGNRSTGIGVPSSNCCGGSFRKNKDNSETVFASHDEDNRSFTSVRSGLKERSGVSRQSSSLNKEIKAAKQLGVIMGAFTLCFLPYFILFLVVSFCDNCIKPGHLTAATWVGYLNSTLNPFLYPLCNANFRNKFRSMLACSSSRRSPLSVTQTDYLQRSTHFHSRYD